jgi:hypothetical protein
MGNRLTDFMGKDHSSFTDVPLKSCVLESTTM